MAHTSNPGSDYSSQQKLLFLAIGAILCVLAILLLAFIGPKSITDRPEVGAIEAPAPAPTAAPGPTLLS